MSKKDEKRKETPPPHVSESRVESPDAAPVEETVTSDVSSPAGPSEATEWQRQASDVSAEIEGLKDRLLRLQADFDNYRKRTARDWTEMCARANEELITALLPVLDHFELGLRAAEEHGAPESVRAGFRLLYDQMCETLMRFGLETIQTENRPFSAHEHEAIAHEPSETVEADHVIRQVRRGYRLGHRLLRPAQVIISSGPPSEVPPTAAAEQT